MSRLCTGKDKILQASCCAASAVAILARDVSSSSPDVVDQETTQTRALRWSTAVAAVSLAGQLVHSAFQEEEPEKISERPDDKQLTLREEEGVTKLVPVRITPKHKVDGPLKKYSMEEVATHNSKDNLWIIVDGLVYDCTRFVDKHPGGAVPVINMAGKDCTDVFANYHAVKVYKHMLPAYLVGEVSEYAVYPHVVDFRNIRQELLRRGLFETDMRFYAKMAAWLASLFFGALWFSIGGTTAGTRMMGAAIMGIFWQQLAGIGHDLGHSGVTHIFWLDHLMGSSLSALMGLSTCWWKRNHNTHHIVCNSVEHDPDIQHLPAFAVTSKIFARPYWSTYYSKWFCFDAVARFLVSHQHILFYPIMMVARFNLYAQSCIQLLSPEPLRYRKTEICCMLVFAIWVIKLACSMPTWFETAGWMLISHAVGGLLHIQIVISHWAMETYHGHAYNDEKDEWYITQLKTTMNVDTPPMLDWVHIGLQFQIEHHLYPRLPRHNLRKARVLVKEVCKKHKIHYHEPGFFQSNVETIRALYRTACIARQATRGDGGFYQSAIWDGMKLNG